jgi:hypothetical protein
VPRNITTRVGQTAFLNCRVEQLGDKSVSIFSFDDLLVVDWSIIFHSIWELNLYFLGSHGRGFSSNSSQEFFFRIWLVFIQFQLML